MTGQIFKTSGIGGELNYSYFNSGLQNKTTLNGATLNSSSYDLFGNQTEMEDISGGTNFYEYDTYDRLIKQTNALGEETSQTFDDAGRLETSVSSEVTTTYAYVESGNGVNNVESISSTSGSSLNYEYDTYGRVIRTEKTINGVSFSFQTEFNDIGQVEKLIYPSGFAIDYIYDDKGVMVQLNKSGGTENIWTSSGYDVAGSPLGHSVQNNNFHLDVSNTFDPITKQLREVKATFGNMLLQKLKYNYFPLTGNMESREDLISNNKENFTYDNLDRLTSYQVNTGNITSMVFADNGNIDSKTGIGTYNYGGNTSNAVSTITNEDGVISEITQNITYNSFHSPILITEGDNELGLHYGINNSRDYTKLIIKSTGLSIYEKYFAGNYEKIINGGNTYEVHYISGTDGLAALYVITNGGAGEMYYPLTDHQGTITKLIDEQGNVFAEQNFDPWEGGAKDVQWTSLANETAFCVGRSAATWDNTNITETPIWLRGYTGHEMLPEFELINMNGRMYDPTIARMLSVDNYVQLPNNAQSYNRYSYVLNNPLRYTDPSGEFIGALFFAGAFLVEFASLKMNGYSNAGNLAYTNVSTAISGASQVLQVPVYEGQKSRITVGIDPFAFGVSANYYYNNGNGYGASASVGAGLIAGGLMLVAQFLFQRRHLLHLD